MIRFRYLAAAAVLTLVPGAAFAAEAPGARNVILMISDGAGFNGWLAADYYEGRAGAQPYQVVRPDGTAPYVGASAHYALRLIAPDGSVLENNQIDAARGAEAQYYDPRDRWTRLEGAFANDFGDVSIAYTSYTDSAAAGTALHSGRKTSPGRLNMTWDGSQRLQTIGHIAHEMGLATGAIATVQVSHATPASVWAQVDFRNQYAEIFQQMADGRLDVMMGTGDPYFDPTGRPVEEPNDRAFNFVGGRDTWTALTGEEGLNGYTLIRERAAFEQLAEGGGDLPARLIGILPSTGSHQATRMDFPADASTPSGMAFNPDMPDLATMSRAALNVLNQDPDGFFLMIEGGAVDWMGHANNMPRFIEEQMDFNAAVNAVIDWVETHSSWDDTLLIITSDHETGGIWGDGTFEAASGLPQQITMDQDVLNQTRFDPARDRFVEFRAVQDRGAGEIPGHQFASGNHTNDLVPLWALGTGSHLFAQFERHDAFAQELWGEPYGWDGNYVDNTAVFHVMNAVLANRARAAAQQAAE
ncbi:alkaline phosphatase [Hyphomonadaceae bacterium BL14]|nr:alkaline phosphatase [Hyphomonadaceae bacterium BL14]